MEDPPDGFGAVAIDFDDSSAVLAHVAISVRCRPDKPAFLYAASVAFAYIDRLLLRVKAGHIGQRASHHAASRIVICGLGNRDELDAVITFELLKFNVIREITSGAVNLIEQQTVEFGRVFLRECQDFFERFALVAVSATEEFPRRILAQNSRLADAASIRHQNSFAMPGNTLRTNLVHPSSKPVWALSIPARRKSGSSAIQDTPGDHRFATTVDDASQTNATL